MEALSYSVTTHTLSNNFPVKPLKAPPNIFTLNIKFANPLKNETRLNLSLSSYFIYCISPSTRASATSTSASASFNSSSLSSTSVDNRHWMVLMDKPPQGLNSKPEIVDYYVNTLARVLSNEKDAQMCIYDASCDNPFGFCCDVDDEASRELARLPGVLSVRPDLDYNSEKKDYSSSNVQSSNILVSPVGSVPLFLSWNTKHWLVRIDKLRVGVVTKAQMVDYYVQILTKVLGSEKDAQMCIYHISWQSNFGFCCELDDECAKELAGVPGVLAVNPDTNFKSENKDYGGDILRSSTVPPDSPEASQEIPIKTKKLFVTGLSFYTSEKTLRAAFEGFGVLVEVKIIMDKISKRSKGFAFVEYTTEEAASAALKEMNGKIINGWMIVVDVAKTKPPKNSRSRTRSEV